MSTKHRSVWSYFLLPALAFVVAVGLAGLSGGAALAATVAVLAVLEVSLSFDNAVVNAKVLGGWDDRWRKLFLGAGIIVAVFGMRFAFPILIVSVTGGMSPQASLDLALHQPAQYAAVLTSKEHLIAAFGGSFLMLVALEYFLDQEKDSHWLAPLEKLLNKLGNVTMAEAAFTLLALVLATLGVPSGEKIAFLTAGIVGILLFSGVKTLGTVLSGGDVGSKVIRAGIGGFLFLEVLDASFSFDGVIGAFALTNNIIWIMAGLGVGALAVRELTLLAVDRGTLAEFPHLEMGAFWAILALAIMMLVGPVYPLPDIVKGLSGAFFIGAAFLTSLYANRQAIEATAEAT
jgi:hypothetical protein